MWLKELGLSLLGVVLIAGACLTERAFFDDDGRPLLLITVGTVAAWLFRTGARGAPAVLLGFLAAEGLAVALPDAVDPPLLMAADVVMGALLGAALVAIRPGRRIVSAWDPTIVMLLCLGICGPLAVIEQLQSPGTPGLWTDSWVAATTGSLIIIMPTMTWSRPPVRRPAEFVASAAMAVAFGALVPAPVRLGLELPFVAWLALPFLLAVGVRCGKFASAILTSAAVIAVVVSRHIINGIPPSQELLQAEVTAILLVVVTLTVLVLLTNQRSALARLESSREVTGAFLLHSEPMLYVKLLDGDGQIKYHRIGGNNFRGWDPATPADDADLFGRSAAQSIASSDRRVVATGEASVEVEPLTLPDGATRVFLSSRFPLRDGHGRVFGIGGVRSDITELENKAELAREQASLLEAMFDSAPVPTIRVAELEEADELIITAANHAAALVSGRAQAELVGLPLDALVAPDRLDDLRGLFRRARSGSRPSRWHPQGEFRVPVADAADRLVVMTVGRLTRAVGGSGPTLADQYVVHLEDITARRAAEEAVARNSMFDSQTGLLNRRSLDDRLDAALHRLSKEGGAGVSLIVLDIDEFKSVNDSHGHPVGDRVLVELASRLRTAAPEGASVARLGADEFAVVADLGTTAAAGVVVGALQHAAAEVMSLDGVDISLSMSAGVAVALEYDVSSVEVMRRAELALYLAKRAGHGNVEFYAHSMRAQAQRTLNVRKELGWALAHRAFDIHVQPIVELSDGRTLGYEVLVRLPTSEGKVLPPGEFLPVARSADLIGAMDRIVLDQALTAAAQGLLEVPGAYLSVNCEASELREPDYSLWVLNSLHAAGVDPSRLVIEVTESALLQMSAQVLANVRSLKDAGVRLAIDDFGTGYSSLSQLRHLNADVLKIDRSFISEMGEDPEAANIVATIVALAHRLELSVIAEGIETREQAEELRRLGCDMGQGYLFGRPVAVKAPKSSQAVPPQRTKSHAPSVEAELRLD